MSTYDLNCALKSYVSLPLHLYPGRTVLGLLIRSRVSWWTKLCDCLENERLVTEWSYDKQLLSLSISLATGSYHSVWVPTSRATMTDSIFKLGWWCSPSFVDVTEHETLSVTIRMSRGCKSSLNVVWLTGLHHDLRGTFVAVYTCVECWHFTSIPSLRTHTNARWDQDLSPAS